MSYDLVDIRKPTKVEKDSSSFTSNATNTIHNTCKVKRYHIILGRPKLYLLEVHTTTHVYSLLNERHHTYGETKWLICRRKNSTVLETYYTLSSALESIRSNYQEQVVPHK